MAKKQNNMEHSLLPIPETDAVRRENLIYSTPII